LNIFAEELNTRCREAYQLKLKGLATQRALDEWTRTLENDVAQLHDLDTTKAASKVVDIEDELLKIVCTPWGTMLSPHNSH
jgi:hypothetical protein